MPRTKTNPVHDDYLALVMTFPLRPIRSASDHAAALRMTGELIGLTRKLTPGESDYFQALTTFVREYERGKAAHRDRPRRSGLDLLKFILSESGTGVGQFGKIIGVGKSAASLILSGRRDLTKNHIARLSERFKVGPQVFFQ